MDNELIIMAVVIAAMILGFIIFIVSTIRNSSNPANVSPETYEALDEEIEEPEPEAVGAVVISKRMDGEWGGNVNTPHYNDCYFVTFLTDAGETKEFRVGKETFDAVYEGQGSTLITVDGKFFAFDDGEEIAEELQDE